MNAETGIREGSIYGGSYRSDSDIAAEIGCHPNTIKLWRGKLIKAGGYIRVNRGSNGYQYFVLNSCKWPEKATSGALPDGQNGVYQKDKDCLSEPQSLSITGPVSFNDNTKTFKRKRDAKTAPASSLPKKDFENLKIREFLEFWTAQYEESYGRKPTLSWGKELRRVRPILRQHDADTVKAAALSYLGDRSDWVKGHCLGPFVSQFDKWLAQTTGGGKARPVTAGAAAGGKFDELLTL